MARNLQVPQIQTLINAVTVTATGSSAVFNLPIGDSYTFAIIAASVTGTSPTYDVVYQSSYDGGTTFVNLPWRHAQITAATTLLLTVRLGLGVGEVGFEGAVAATGGTLVKPAVPPSLAKFRLGYTVGGTSPSAAITLLCFAMPPGSLPFA
jgi:hypothetical protein